MKRLGTPWIIHGFALLHAAGTVVCSLAGWPDSMLLTALTMALAVLICYRAKLTVEITIAALFLVNIIGFVVGNLGARFLAVFLPPLLHHSITTFLVTELLGWALLLFGRTVAPHGAAGYERKVSWRHNWGWLVFAIVAVLGLRIWFGLTYSGDFLAETGVMGILMIITVLTLAYMVTFAVQMQREASSQRTRRHQAEFRYMTLKHQVNPHFLFNSLNVLDSIVQDGTREEASAYIHKMAELYRYLMQQEGKRLVPLADEIGFARTYRELMQIRFPEGLQFKGLDPARIPDGSIVPCTL